MGFLIFGTQNIISTTVNMNETNYFFNFDLHKIILSVVTASVLIAIIGLNVLGSGLNDESIKIIKQVLSYYFVWLLISIFTYNVFYYAIPHLGISIYWILTLLYGIAVLLNEGGS